MATPKTIFLKGDGPQDEAPAAGTITPGMLVEKDSSGDYVAHATAEGFAVPIFAIEDAFQGHDIDDDYSADDQVFVKYAQRGSVVYSKLAAGNNVSIGTKLASDGNGWLQAYVRDSANAPEEGAVVAIADEAVNASGAIARIKVRVV